MTDPRGDSARSRTRRLLLVAQPLTGGVPGHVLDLVEGLSASDWEITVACPTTSTLWRALADRPRVTLCRISAARRPGPSDVISLRRLLRLVREADVIHAHSSKAGFLTRLAALLRGRARTTIYTPNAWSFWAVSGPEARLYRTLERVAARWCCIIVAVSDHERRSGLEAGVGSPEKYRIIPNGVDIARFDRPRDPVPGRVLFLGRLARQKRPDLAIEALARVRKRVPHAELHLASEGPEREDIERLAARLGVADAVVFLGYRDDVPALLARAACVLLTSDYEGAPLTVVEAMAAGVPLVATRVGGIPEVVSHGETGFLANAGDVATLGNAVAQVLEEPELARRLGESGRRLVRRSYAREEMVASTLALYEEVYDESSAPTRRTYASAS